MFHHALRRQQPRRHDNKRAGHEDADYRGQIDIDGREFWLNAWIREAKADGQKFMSLSVRPKEAGQPTTRPATRAWRSSRYSNALLVGRFAVAPED
jgi:hypothetical protein